MSYSVHFGRIEGTCGNAGISRFASKKDAEDYVERMGNHTFASVEILFSQKENSWCIRCLDLHGNVVGYVEELPDAH
jgi:hypothetical protein